MGVLRSKTQTDCVATQRMPFVNVPIVLVTPHSKFCVPELHGVGSEY